MCCDKNIYIYFCFLAPIIHVVIHFVLYELKKLLRSEHILLTLHFIKFELL